MRICWREKPRPRRKRREESWKRRRKKKRKKQLRAKKSQQRRSRQIRRRRGGKEVKSSLFGQGLNPCPNSNKYSKELKAESKHTPVLLYFFKEKLVVILSEALHLLVQGGAKYL
jgi:hypothetical protein